MREIYNSAKYNLILYQLFKYNIMKDYISEECKAYVAYMPPK